MEKQEDYLKIGKASSLSGRDYRIYRYLEIFPGFFSLATLIILVIFSYFKPIWVAYFIIAFDVYWLLLVIYMAIFLITSYYGLKTGLNTDWRKKCHDLAAGDSKELASAGENSLCRRGVSWQNLWQLVILPNYNEDEDILRTALNSLINDGFPTERMIVALAMEERAGAEAKEKAAVMEKEFSKSFGRFIITFHPDALPGELKGKGANQAWSAKIIKEQIVEKESLDQEMILVSVFDIDTIVHPGYFYALSYTFLTVDDPYRASYQPVPVYHNNIWNAPFFSRVCASSNTFWQMIMQVRRESLVTYSSHSMTWKALSEIGFWSTTNVSEDSRIFWHCLMHYNGHYRVEPIHFSVSMDATYDRGFWSTAKSLYKQQRRWAWGGENIPYLVFNAYKRWNNPDFDRRKISEHILIQVYGFHAWATTALIIAIIGWLPMLLGGDRFNSTVLSGNLPSVTETLMNIAMIGLVLSAVISALLLPPKPERYGRWKKVWMTAEWIAVPVTIIFFGSIPCLEAQIRLMRGKYMGYWVTPKSR